MLNVRNVMLFGVNEHEFEIPTDGKSFEIEKYGFHYGWDYKKVKFSYSSDIRKRKEYIFGID